MCPAGRLRRIGRQTAWFGKVSARRSSTVALPQVPRTGGGGNAFNRRGVSKVQEPAGAQRQGAGKRGIAPEGGARISRQQVQDRPELLDGLLRALDEDQAV